MYKQIWYIYNTRQSVILFNSSYIITVKIFFFYIKAHKAAYNNLIFFPCFAWLPLSPSHLLLFLFVLCLFYVRLNKGYIQPARLEEGAAGASNRKKT